MRPADSPVLPDPPVLADSDLVDSDLVDSEDERAGIGENFCQPPLPLLPSRAEVEPPELPGLATSRPLPIDLPFDALAVVLRVEKKC